MENNFISIHNLKLPSKIFHKKIDSSHIITHPTRQSWLVVNNFGWEILQLLDGENSLADIVQIIKSKFNVNEEIIRKDLREFISLIEKSNIFIDEESPVDYEQIRFNSTFLHLTDRCNLQCKHCYTKNMSQNRKELTDDEIENFLKKYYSSIGNNLILSGGEPLMRKNIKNLFKINRNATIRLLTNGILIDDEFASFLSDYDVFIQVSLDGSNETTHDGIRGKESFSATMKGIESLQRKGLGKKINLCTTVMSQNYNDLPNIIELTQTMGIPSIRFLQLRKEGNADYNWNEIQGRLTNKDYENFISYIYENAIEKYPDIMISSGLSGFVMNPRELNQDRHWCTIGMSMVIDPLGNVYPCVLFMNEKYKMGNIKKNSMEEIKNSPILFKLIDAKFERKNKIQKCRECMWKNFCLSGCMGVAIDHVGTIWDTDEFCDLRIKLYEESVIKQSNLKP